MLLLCTQWAVAKENTLLKSERGWSWASTQLVKSADGNISVHQLSGSAEVEVRAQEITITFADGSRSAKMSVIGKMSGRIQASSRIIGSLSGFDPDFEKEPVSGEYRSHVFPDGCVGREILLRDVLPRGRTILLFREDCRRSK